MTIPPALAQEIAQLRQELAKLAQAEERTMRVRYDLLRDKPSATLHDRLWRRVQRACSAIGILPPRVTPYRWSPALNHAPVAEQARTLLIWSEGQTHSAQREACAGWQHALHAISGFAPVLVTDIADFAYYSRLGWLVEYLPDLPRETLNNSCGKHAPANGMQRKAVFAADSGAIGGENQRRDAPRGGMRAAQGVVQSFPREGEEYRARKRRYLAWRYRDACIFPISAGLHAVSALPALLAEEGK